MPVVDPVAWEDVEDAFHHWLVQTTGIDGDRVRVPIVRDHGEARGPAPKAVVSLLSLVETSQTGREFQARITRQRYTVTAAGPGEVGVDFYPARSLTAQRISIMAAEDDAPDVSAAALLVALQADLPAGYTATIDPDDDASVLVDGSEDEPLFAAKTADADFLTVTTAIPRYVTILRKEHRAVWRVSFRAGGVSGSSLAANAMSKAMLYRQTQLDPAMNRLGFRAMGTPQSQPSLPAARDESTAVLDVAFLGLLTGAEAGVPMRAAKLRQAA